ncbi:Na+/H+ antiporter subunit G [Kurthia massiliensis]|uniref:Na+/H+ antiporter subunit G n=1 Tax=Kurthia massiliensis TaxID=1033739 RepID=UPI000287DE95|nr:Na+/H+ antiporter subunit G [Kurthia massiliensis]
MNVNLIVETIAVFFIFFASIMSVISAIGVLRMPDVYTRSHAATKSSTLAVLLSLIGAFIYLIASTNYVSIRLLLGIIFVFLTAPVAGHLITRAAYRSGVKLSEQSGEDALYDQIFDEHGKKRTIERRKEADS